MKRSSKKSDVSPDGFSTGKTTDGLVYYSLKNRGGKIFLGCAIVDQRLDIRFGKYAAAGGNRIKGLIIFCLLI